jgi:uncharacterized membrane protein YhaH (DUF805 family)
LNEGASALIIERCSRGLRGGCDRLVAGIGRHRASSVRTIRARNGAFCATRRRRNMSEGALSLERGRTCMGNIDLIDLLFSFRGRINRGKYWLAFLIYVIFWIVVGIVGWGLLFVAYTLGAIVFTLAFLVSLYSGIAVGIKRLHDRDKTGWYLLLFYLVPALLDGIGNSVGGIGFIFSLAGLAISIWAFIELGCLRGTIGPNQYGPDPLGSV